MIGNTVFLSVAETEDGVSYLPIVNRNSDITQNRAQSFSFPFSGFIQENQVLLWILSFPLKKYPLNISAFLLYFSHWPQWHLLATHQELSTQSTKDILITGGSMLSVLQKKQFLKLNEMENVDREAVLKKWSGGRLRGKRQGCSKKLERGCLTYGLWNN